MKHTTFSIRFVIGLKRSALAIALLLTLAISHAYAQQNSNSKRQNLPSPDKIVNDYLKAIGGKKRVAAIRDATYEWTIVQNAPPFAELGTSTIHLKSPASMHMVANYEDKNGNGINPDVSVTNGPIRIEMGANVRSAWTWHTRAVLQTLTDARAQSVKLSSMLYASHLVDFKKSRVLARTAGSDDSMGESAYIVEFSSRNGARIRYWFSVASKLLLATEENDGEVSERTTLADYRNENGVLEPHKLSISDSKMTLELKQVRYNTGLSDSLFDPPSAEPIDVASILNEIELNQDKIDDRVGEYTYTEKQTERKINDKGEVTEETVKLFEVYPIPDGRDVKKLISENGVLLAAEKAAKEEKHASEELEKAQRESVKIAEKRERDKQAGKKEKPDDDDLGVADFLRVAELVSPRRERLRDRDAIVVDFRPRAGFKPKNSIESIVSKLAGVMWIDPVDKQVMRLEARLIDSYKVGGGLLASIRPGTAVVFEQKRMEDGVWLPVYSQVNISAKVLLFKGINLNVVQEFSNYQRFKGNVEDYKLSVPPPKQ